tara:strand:- start:108 stop:398 length:291 start_codon:yes stop_codon:yes gene_type:complete
MNKIKFSKKVISEIDDFVKGNLDAEEIDIEDFFRTLTVHVIKLNYEYAVDFFSATSMISQCQAMVMEILSSDKRFKELLDSETRYKSGMIENKNIH